MSIKSLRMTLLCLFVICMLISCGAIAWARYENAIGPNSSHELLFKILAVYAVHLSVVLGGMFAVKHPGAPPAMAAPAPPVDYAWGAIVLVTVWNLFVFGRILLFTVLEQDSVSSLSTYLETWGSASAFLVTGALTAIFVKNS